MSFGFGNPSSGSPAGGFSFGANKTTNTGFTLGTAASPASGNLFGNATFGSTPSSQPGTGLFGSSVGQTTGLSFGAPIATIAPTTQTTGLTFGASSTTGTQGSTFGNTSAAPATGLAFGTTSATPAAGLTFGAGSTSGTTGLTFGATSTAGTTGLTFGTPATTGTSGLSFGSPAGQTGGLTFGSPASGTQAGGLSFGTPTAGTGQTGLVFGTTAATATPSAGIKFSLPTTSAPLTGLTFGTPTATTQTGLTFGTPASTVQSGLSFGTPTTSATAGPTVATAGFQSLGTATTAAIKPLTFGCTPSAGFSLSVPTTTSQASSFGLATTCGGLFGQGLSKPLLGATTSGPTLGLGLGIGLATTTTAAATTTSLKGLGGVDTAQSKPGLTGTSPGRADANAVKENLIPNEIVQTIESFKNFVKTQKSSSSDIARGSAKPLYKVQDDTEALKQLLAGLTSGLQRNGLLADKLKADTAKCLHNAELAQRTHETPSGLQYDNLAPLEFFTELVSGYERDMQVFRRELENTEKHVLSLSQSSVLTPQELTLAMRRLHDSFVALAGRLHTVHNSVELQKEQYLNVRKYFLKDTTNVFEETEKKTTVNNAIKTIVRKKNAAGPTPFTALGSQHGFGMLPSSSKETNASFSSGNPLGIWGTGQPIQQQQQQQQPLPQQLPTLSASPSSIGIISSLNFSTNLSNTLTTPQPTENQGFQLQKPPPGNKRSKR